METPESKIKKKIHEYLSKLMNEGKPVYHEVREAGGLTYKKGLPDLWIVVNGIHLEIEVKAENGRRSTLQYKWEEIFRRMNIKYACVDSVEEVAVLVDILLDSASYPNSHERH